MLNLNIIKTKVLKSSIAIEYQRAADAWRLSVWTCRTVGYHIPTKTVDWQCSTWVPTAPAWPPTTTCG